VASPLLLLLLVAAQPAGDVVERVFARQAAVAAQVCSVSYHAEYRYTETNHKDNRRQDVRCSRRVWMRGYENQRHDFQRVSVNGRELRGAEMDREIADLRSKGLVSRSARMPFLVETRGDYRYRLLGTAAAAGQDCWIVGFEPVRPSAKTVRGRSFVLKSSADIVRTEFRPAQVPFVVREMALCLDYGRFGEFWLPTRFTLDLDLRLRFLVTMLDRHIEIEDIYSDYRINGEAAVNRE
jgi:hypothetical protein